MLDLILLAEAPPTPEEEARLRNLPSRSPEKIIERLLAPAEARKRLEEEADRGRCIESND